MNDSSTTRNTRNGLVLSRRFIQGALVQIANRLELSWINVSEYADRLGDIEAIAHELAHTLDLGSEFEVSIRRMGDVEANEHEAATLRIELAALARLGVRLSARRLWVTANFRDIGRPRLVDLRSPLDDHEQHCVAQFVEMVRQEVIW